MCQCFVYLHHPHWFDLILALYRHYCVDPIQDNIFKFRSQCSWHSSNISLEQTLRREASTSKFCNLQFRVSEDMSFLRSTDQLFVVNSFKSPQNGFRAINFENTCGEKLSLSLRFLPPKPLKKFECFNSLLHRNFTTTAMNTCTNDEKNSEISFQDVGVGLTHVNEEGKANMVDVGDKVDTLRYSVAKATVQLNAEAFKLVKENKMKKGDVMNVAKLAGIMAAKQTASLIPLCHNIPLTNIEVEMKLEELTHSVVIEGKVKCFGKTGVEMEALTCVSVAALTVYDMCKALSKHIVIADVQLMEKDGGKSGYFLRKERN